MKVLVTGAAGFIGSHLVDALVERGLEVTGIDCLVEQVHRGKKPAYLNPKVEYAFQDVADAAALARTLEGVEAVVHLAASVGVGQSMYQIERYVSNNVLATARLLEAVVERKRSIRRLIVASSMSTYGEGAYSCRLCGPQWSVPERPLEQLERRAWEPRCPSCGQALAPGLTPETKNQQSISVYAVTKRDQEELCLSVGRAYGIPAVALRLFNVYGERQALSNPYTGAAAIFACRLLNDKPPLVFEDGAQTRDFIHVSDIVQALLLALEDRTVSCDVFNVGTGRAAAIMDVARLLQAALGARVEPQVVGRFRAGDIRHCAADISKIVRLGFLPRVRLEDGLARTAEWIRGQAPEDLVESAGRELESRGLTL